MNKHKVAMTTSVFAGLVHLVWEVALFLGLAQSFVNWKMSMHSISASVKVLPFNLGSAIGLVIAALIGAYIVGWVFATIYNKMHR